LIEIASVDEGFGDLGRVERVDKEKLMPKRLPQMRRRNDHFNF
jgi:hypothetical protein